MTKQSMDNPEGTEGANQPLTQQELDELKALLETEKLARADAEAKLTEINGTIAKRDARILELETAATEKDSLIATLNLSVADTATLSQSLQDAISAYKTTITKANPSIPAELITGDTIEAINHSLESAFSIVTKVRETITDEIAAGTVPAGAPARSAPDLSALSPREKIQYAITKGGK